MPLIPDKSVLAQLLLRFTDYQTYKNNKFIAKLGQVQPHSFELPDKQRDVYFKHSGNLGDIIYSLPAAQALGQGRNIHFRLKPHVEGQYGKNKHPSGAFMLTENGISMLSPLLESQAGIDSVRAIEPGDTIDFDLDLVREYPFSLKYGNICRWYFHVFATSADLGKPWLHVDPLPEAKNWIVISRSGRHQAPGIDYGFLAKYPNLVFVGLEEEWHAMKFYLPLIRFQPVRHFLELGQIIKGSKLFIGNQSFPFALAEATKATRMLEVFHLSPNVNVEGPNAYDFCYQPQFELLVKKILDRD